MSEYRGATTALEKENETGSHHERKHRHWDAGGNPLAHVASYDGSERLTAFGGALQPGLYKPPDKKIANPAPLGLAGFALTTFLLSMINLGARGLAAPNLVIGPAFAYGGLVQLLAGMWAIGFGNTFAGTALSSYGGIWISLGIILTPGGFGIMDAYPSTGDFYATFGLYLIGVFIFTFLLWLITLKSTVAFCTLIFTVWLTFLFLAIAYLDAASRGGMPNVGLTRAGGATGIIAAFLAWYNMIAGMADTSNSFFVIPVVHFPWSEKGRQQRQEELEGKRNEEIA